MYKLSIIIPFYNSESKIKFLLNSIKKVKKYEDLIEFIFINDGSKDNSENLIKTFKKENNLEIILYKQKNKGLSSARNKGLAIAKGDYVWFVDSDDSIISKNINRLLIKLNVEFDIISFPIIKVGSKAKKINNFFDSSKRLIGAPYYIYNRNFLIKNKIKFTPKLIHEDLEFLPRVWDVYNSHYHLNFPLYKHIITENSITTSRVKLDRVISLLKIAVLHSKRLREKPSIFNLYSLVAINSAFRNSMRLNRCDFNLLKVHLKENMNNYNKLFDVKYIGIIKVKSIITLICFNILSKF